MLFHALTQKAAGAEETRLGGGVADAEEVTHFAGLGFFEVGQLEGAAEFGRDALDLAADQIDDFLTGEIGFGVAIFDGKDRGQHFAIDFHLERNLTLGAGQLAEAHQALIDEDTVEPSGKLGVAAERIDILVSLPESILDLFLCILGRAQVHAGGFEADGLIAAGEFSECFVVALTDQVD